MDWEQGQKEQTSSLLPVYGRSPENNTSLGCIMFSVHDPHVLRTMGSYEEGLLMTKAPRDTELRLVRSEVTQRNTTHRFVYWPYGLLCG